MINDASNTITQHLSGHNEAAANQVLEEILAEGPERTEREFWDAVADPRRAEDFKGALHRALSGKPKYPGELSISIDRIMAAHAYDLAMERLHEAKEAREEALADEVMW